MGSEYRVPCGLGANDPSPGDRGCGDGWMCPACTEIERLRTELADERTAHAITLAGRDAAVNEVNRLIKDLKAERDCHAETRRLDVLLVAIPGCPYDFLPWLRGDEW